MLEGYSATSIHQLVLYLFTLVSFTHTARLKVRALECEDGSSTREFRRRSQAEQKSLSHLRDRLVREHSAVDARLTVVSSAIAATEAHIMPLFERLSRVMQRVCNGHTGSDAPQTELNDSSTSYTSSSGTVKARRRSQAAKLCAKLAAAGGAVAPGALLSAGGLPCLSTLPPPLTAGDVLLINACLPSPLTVTTTTTAATATAAAKTAKDTSPSRCRLPTVLGNSSSSSKEQLKAANYFYGCGGGSGSNDGASRESFDIDDTADLESLGSSMEALLREERRYRRKHGHTVVSSGDSVSSEVSMSASTGSLSAVGRRAQAASRVGQVAVLGGTGMPVRLINAATRARGRSEVLRRALA
jgi:hypothetical protein